MAYSESVKGQTVNTLVFGASHGLCHRDFFAFYVFLGHKKDYFFEKGKQITGCGGDLARRP